MPIGGEGIKNLLMNMMLNNKTFIIKNPKAHISMCLCI